MRSPLAATIATFLVIGAWFFLARRAQSIAADLEAGWHFVERNSSRLIGLVALVAAIVAATFATRSASGADASGYLSQAQAWREGMPFHFEPLAMSPELRGWATMPLGWRPHDPPAVLDVSSVGAQVPTYPPGLPLLMAIPHAIAGLDGANAIVIASAAIAAWAAGVIAGGVAGVIAALLLAFTPVFLYQSIQPMSDVPVTAAWVLTFLLLRGERSFWGGVACAAAVLIRPNLAPLAIVPLFLARQRVRFAAPVAAAGVLLALLQWLSYGSPLQSGYGSAGELFALSNVFPNAALYSKWLIATAPILLVGVAAMVRLRHIARARALIAFAVLVVAAYLVYAQFEHWSYLRFLLPALAVLAVFAGFEMALWIDRRAARLRLPLMVAVMLAIVAHGLSVARSLDTFRLRDQLRRVEQVAQEIDRTVPSNAVLIAGEQSGSMRYYTGRSILRWDAATAETMPKAIEALVKVERPLYVVLDAWEVEPFRKKFPGIPAVGLDWPPMVEAGSSHRTTLWRLTDRERFLAGETLQTVRIP